MRAGVRSGSGTGSSVPDSCPVRTLLLMAVGVVAVSLSGPLMAAAVVPPLAIAFWRNAFATAAIAPVVAVGRRAKSCAT